MTERKIIEVTCDECGKVTSDTRFSQPYRSLSSEAARIELHVEPLIGPSTP